MNKQRLTDKQLKERNEEKQKAFKRVVVPRVAKAVKAINLIANCSGAGYSYTKEQAEQIKTALQTTLDDLSKKFTGTQDKTTSFELTS